MSDGAVALHLVPMGVYYGTGKDGQRAVNTFLMGCYDPEHEQVLSVCKVGVGIPEDTIKVLLENQEITPVPPTTFQTTSTLTPDAWVVGGSSVWVVAAAEVALSPGAAAARNLVEDGKGVTARFPRFIAVSDGRIAETATTVAMLMELYLASKK